MRLEADTVVGRVDERIGDGGVAAVDDVEPVVVPVGLAVDGDAVDLQPIALVVGLHPVARVLQRDAIDGDVFAFAEIERPCAARSIGPVVFGRVVDDPFLDLVEQVIRRLAALAVDDPLAGNRDIVDLNRPHQCAVGTVDRVVVRVRRTEQYGAFVELDRDVRAQVDAAGQVTAHVEDEAPATLGVDVVYRLLDRGGVQRRTVGFDAEERGVVILRPQLHRTQDGQC